MNDREDKGGIALGEVDGLEFRVQAWAPAQADVDLSFACMFEHEAEGATMSGGLLHLDEALGNLLSSLRAEGSFRGQEMETLYISLPSAGLRPRAVMVIGLGDPATITAERLERATRIAYREASRLGVRTVAFAPDLLDAGVQGIVGTGAAMLRGVVGALRSEKRLAKSGFVPEPSVQSWTFDAGAAHLDAVEIEFRSEINRILEDRSS
jgi:hypothetical protein